MGFGSNGIQRTSINPRFNGVYTVLHVVFERWK